MRALSLFSIKFFIFFLPILIVAHLVVAHLVVVDLVVVSGVLLVSNEVEDVSLLLVTGMCVYVDTC